MNKNIFVSIVMLVLLVSFVSADTGGTITTDGLYTVHTFLTNGTYTSSDSKNIEVLIVGGGGAGGASATSNNGGGGAGGLIYNSSYPVTSTNYSIIVGLGGLPVTSNKGANGENSSFNNTQARGGGGGGGVGGVNGGSGGGAGQQSVKGNGTIGQGNDGGTGGATGYGGAGGGGHNTTGFNPSEQANGFGAGGLGGTGTNFSINGTSICYAGGGGGSTHSANLTWTGSVGGCGVAGGGLGSVKGATIVATYGKNGTGNGGGGGGEANYGNAGGGSGIVIIRYLTPIPQFNITDIVYLSDTSTNGVVKYYTNPLLTISTNSTFYGGVVNTTHRVYNETGALIFNYTNSTTNITAITKNIFTLPIGTFYYNATATNGTNTNNTATRTIYIYNSTSGTILSPLNNYNSSSRYLNITFTNMTFTKNITIINTVLFLLNNDLSVNRTIKSNATTFNNFSYDLYIQNLTTGIYYIRMEQTDLNNINVTTQNRFNLTTNGNLTIQFQNGYNGSSILNNGTINATIDGVTSTYNILNGRTSFDIAKNSLYDLFVNMDGYAYSQVNYTTNDSTYQTTNLTLYTNNSILINIYDESTGTPITNNITITLSGITTNIYNTNTSQIFIANINDGNYSVIFQGSGYAIKTYLITVASRSTQSLNAFLTTNSSLVIFAIKDFDSGAVLEGASFSQYRLINGTWTLLDSKLSDITGRVGIYYLPNVRYRFVVGLSGYTSQTFELNPVLFSSYDIRLQKTTTLIPANTPSGTSISITYNPTLFFNNRTNNFTWNIVSPLGSLTSYSLNLAYPGGSRSFSGVNAIGEQINTNMTINGANLTSKVRVGYCYQSTTSANLCFNYSYDISSVNQTNSFLGTVLNGVNTYGLGNWERVLIMTLIIMVVTAVAYAFAGMIPGLIMTVFLMAYFLGTEFVPLWSVVIPLLFGSLIIMFSGGKR